MAEKRKLLVLIPVVERLVPGGVIGNTRDFDSLILGSSPSRVTLVISTGWILATVFVEGHGRRRRYVVAVGQAIDWNFYRGVE